MGNAVLSVELGYGKVVARKVSETVPGMVKV